VPDPNLQALVFDAYGTLFDVHSVVERCERAFPGHGLELSRAWRGKQLEYTWLRSLMGRHGDFWQLTGDALGFACRALGLPCPPAVHRDLMDAYLRLDCFPEVKDALAQMRPLTLAILSNGTPAMLDAVVAHQSLDDRFAAVISVEEAGIFKPHPSVYALAPLRLGVAKERIGFVSANGWDVAGASSFGFTAFWVNRTGAPEETLPGGPWRSFRSLDELPPLFG
jgi:2-haloacid dehalogenase